MVFFIFIQISITNSGNWSGVSDLGLHCLPLSHKKDARLKWVKRTFSVRYFKKSSNLPKICLFDMIIFVK